MRWVIVPRLFPRASKYWRYRRSNGYSIPYKIARKTVSGETAPHAPISVTTASTDRSSVCHRRVMGGMFRRSRACSIGQTRNPEISGQEPQLEIVT